MRMNGPGVEKEKLESDPELKSVVETFNPYLIHC